MGSECIYDTWKSLIIGVSWGKNRADPFRPLFALLAMFIRHKIFLI